MHQDKESAATREKKMFRRSVVHMVTEGRGNVWLDIGIIPTLEEWRELNARNKTSYPYPWREFSKSAPGEAG